jgi:cell division protein FtsL
MMDWANRMEIRNSGIKRKTDRQHMGELLRIILSILMMGGVLFFYSWIRVRIMEMGYEEQRLQASEEEMMRLQRNLILEQETLKNPERIEDIAQNYLGMTRVQPNQLILPRIEQMELGRPTALAMAGKAGDAGGQGKSADTN